MVKKFTRFKDYEISFILLFFWIILALYLTISKPTVGISDMFWFIERANTLSLHSSKYWVDGFYPIGYPVILKIVSNIFCDYVVGGRMISITCGIIGLISTYLIGRELFGNFFGIISLLLVGFNPIYLKFSTISSTDIPSASFLLLGCYFFVKFLRNEDGKFIFLSGLSLGFSYMMRYTALTVVPIFLIFLIFSKGKEKFLNPIKFLSSFILISSPQLILSTIYKGNPFYNLQAQNVYFGIFGNQNWGLHMADAKKIKGIFEIVEKYPYPFLKNWSKNIVEGFKIEFLKFLPLLLSILGGGILYFKRVKKETIFLFLIFLSFTLSICMAFPNGRLLIPPIMVLSVFSGYFFGQILPSKVYLKEILTFIAISTIFYFYTYPFISHPMTQFDKIRIEISKTLHKSGIKSSKDVLSFSFEYYDLESNTKDRFQIPWYYNGFKGYSSLKEIANYMGKSKMQFFVFDKNAPKNVKGVKNFWPFKKSELKKYFTHIKTIKNFAEIYELKNVESVKVISARRQK